MELRTYDEVDSADVAWLNRIALDYEISPARIARVRKLDPRVPPEFAWYACEGGRPVSQVGYLRIPVQTTEGREIIGGIAAVCTLPRAGRRGLGRRLLEHVHGVLRDGGVRLALLGTSKMRVAYDHYRALGYADLVTSRAACGRVPRLDPSRRRTRAATARDEDLIGELHARRVRGALGFVERPPRFLRIRQASGYPRDRLRILLQGGRAVGYALRKAGLSPGIEELLVPDGDPLPWVAHLSRGRDMRLSLSPRDHAEPYRKAGLRVEPTWGVLMGADLEGRIPASALRNLLGIPVGRFELLEMDAF